MEDAVYLPNLAAARTEAVTIIRAILEADTQCGTINLNRTVDICDAAGDVLLSVRFKDALN